MNRANQAKKSSDLGIGESLGDDIGHPEVVAMAASTRKGTTVIGRPIVEENSGCGLKERELFGSAGSGDGKQGQLLAAQPIEEGGRSQQGRGCARVEIARAQGVMSSGDVKLWLQADWKPTQGVVRPARANVSATVNRSTARTGANQQRGGYCSYRQGADRATSNI